MVNHTIDIYSFPMSPPSRAALLLLRYLGLKHNINMVNIPNGEHMKPEFLKLNPLHQIPVIKDGEFVLSDSNAIMKYLVDQYAKDDGLYPKDPKKGAMIPILFDMDQVPDAKNKLEEGLKHTDNFLATQKWFAGDNITVADFGLITLIATIDSCGNFDLQLEFPNINQWYQRAKTTMSGFGYQEVNQEGADMFGNSVKSKLKSV